MLAITHAHSHSLTHSLSPPTLEEEEVLGDLLDQLFADFFRIEFGEEEEAEREIGRQSLIPDLLLHLQPTRVPLRVHVLQQGETTHSLE